jgi:hypothetical protein
MNDYSVRYGGITDSWTSRHFREGLSRPAPHNHFGHVAAPFDGFDFDQYRAGDNGYFLDAVGSLTR